MRKKSCVSPCRLNFVVLKKKKLFNVTKTFQRFKWSAKEKKNYQTKCYEPFRTFFCILFCFQILFRCAKSTRGAPKVMPSIYYHGNYERYREHNDAIRKSKFSATKHRDIICFESVKEDRIK